MKNIIRKMYLLVIVASAFLLFGCSELLDCVANARPNIKSKVLRIGTFGITYNDFVEADIINDSDDNSYYYSFSISGNFPPGMSYNQQGNKVFFNGSPTQSGSFTFKVSLTVDPPEYYDPNQGFFEDGNRICFGNDTTAKEFTIIIQ
jgi:hypothetical protein